MKKWDVGRPGKQVLLHKQFYLALSVAQETWSQISVPHIGQTVVHFMHPNIVIPITKQYIQFYKLKLAVLNDIKHW